MLPELSMKVYQVTWYLELLPEINIKEGGEAFKDSKKGHKNNYHIVSIPSLFLGRRVDIPFFLGKSQIGEMGLCSQMQASELLFTLCYK